MAMVQQKYYVVWRGSKPGIYTNWIDCRLQVSHYKNAKYKSFTIKEAAEQAYLEGWEKHVGKGKGSEQVSVKSGDLLSSAAEIDYDSISVDVGTRGNPGPIEYRGVDTRTGEVLFAKGPIPNGTNNVGEFLAIVHSLAYLQQQGSHKTVYSDSATALKWVKQKKVVTTLVKNEATKEVWELIHRALTWLQMNHYCNPVLKWDTKRWGEIKADYNRK